MSRRPHTLDQFNDAGGSCTQIDTMVSSEEPLMFGRAVSGQIGASASISAVLGSKATVAGLTGMTALSVGRCITLAGTTSAGNSGTFRITDFFSPSTVNIENTSAVAPDGSNGAISWVEREPYSLEDDLNYRRTTERLIKGTPDWYDPIPIYTRPTATGTSVNADLTNIADKTLDAHAWFEPRGVENVSVATGATFKTLIIVGAFKHATAIDTTGIAITDGFDAGNLEGAHVAIIDADNDGAGDGAALRVLSGVNIGERIIGLTREGSSTSPDSVEVEFFSSPIDDWDLSTLTAYTWEADQVNTVNMCYGYRQRLDLFDENAVRRVFVKGTGGGSGLPAADCPCQVLYSLDGITFAPETPLTARGGWLVNDDGCLLVV